MEMLGSPIFDGAPPMGQRPPLFPSGRELMGLPFALRPTMRPSKRTSNSIRIVPTSDMLWMFGWPYLTVVVVNGSSRRDANCCCEPGWLH